jgi:flagellar basal-body rod modification protein FlgD
MTMATNAVSSGPSTGAAADTTTTAQTKDRGMVNKETFLQLLVAQIKNQNPLNPADGVQFLTQLAQFSELEQMMSIRTEISGLREDLTKPATSETGEGSNV